MIRDFSMVRTNPGGRLGFVCDFQEDVIGDLDDPSCVRSIELFEPSRPYNDWERNDYFLADLDEIEEAAGSDRDFVCDNFDHVEISNYWTEDTPPDQHYFIWLTLNGEGAEAWLRKGYRTDFEHLMTLSPSKLLLVRRAFNQAKIQKWKPYYPQDGWCIGGNAWGFSLICGNRMVSTGGEDKHPAALEGLCDALRSIGLPIKFRDDYGLEYDPPRQKKKRKSRGERRSEGTS